MQSVWSVCGVYGVLVRRGRCTGTLLVLSAACSSLLILLQVDSDNSSPPAERGPAAAAAAAAAGCSARFLLRCCSCAHCEAEAACADGSFFVGALHRPR